MKRYGNAMDANMGRRAELGRPLTLAERQKRFRKAQAEKKRILEAQIRVAELRLGQYSNAELGEQIAVMCERHHPEHQSVRDRVLLLAHRMGIVGSGEQEKERMGKARET